MYPTFDEYVYTGLKHKKIHNLIHPTSEIEKIGPEALSCAITYCEFMNMDAQLAQVYESIPIRTYGPLIFNADGYQTKNDGKAILPLYNIKSGEFNNGKNPKIMGELDNIFQKFSPLTKALTVYRKYECPPNLLDISKGEVFISNRFLSTSLSLSYLSSVTFWDDCPDDDPIYCRIDIMPGVKVIPLLNRNDFAQIDGTPVSETTEFEILLPRNALLYKLTESYSYENTPALTIIQKDEDDDKKVVDKKPAIPIISHHFVLAPDVSEFNIQYPKHTAFPDIQPDIVNVKLTEKQIASFQEIQRRMETEQYEIRQDERKRAKKAELRREYVTGNHMTDHDKDSFFPYSIQRPSPVEPQEQLRPPQHESYLDDDDEEWEDAGGGKKKNKRPRKLTKRKKRKNLRFYTF